MTTHKSSKCGLKRAVVLGDGFIYMETGKIFRTQKCHLKIEQAVTPQGANSVRSSIVTAKSKTLRAGLKQCRKKCPLTWDHLSWWKRSASCRRCTCWRGSSASQCRHPGCLSTRSSHPSPQHWRHSPRKHIQRTHAKLSPYQPSLCTCCTLPTVMFCGRGSYPFFFMVKSREGAGSVHSGSLV